MMEPADREGTGSGLSPESEGERYLICTVLGVYYAFPSYVISEIALLDRVYPLPLLPEYLPGIINRYAAPYALLDIGCLVAGKRGSGTKVLVLKDLAAVPGTEGGAEPGNPNNAALLIDDVVDFAELPRSEVLPVEGGDDADGGVVSSFSWKGNPVFVLDVRRILDRAAGDVAG
jgi:purine-binding chemotaxis protein CheW